MKPSLHIFWFRRDLRLEDNAGLYHALKSGLKVLPIFIFDRFILDALADRKDRRVEFIHSALIRLNQQLEALHSSLEVYHGQPEQVFRKLIGQYDLRAVFTNHDYEPYARTRDEQLCKLLKTEGIEFSSFKDQVIFEKDELLKDDGKPYSVFTPYSKRWKAALKPFHVKAYPTEKYFAHFYRQAAKPIPSLEEIGFIESGKPFPSEDPGDQLIRQYSQLRDFPAADGTSRLGVHLRFGTISIRAIVARAISLNEIFLNELIWREFYQMILWHFPQVGVGKSFRPEYDRILWRHDESDFHSWCNGMTGYPIVDAGMRELNATGFMHNRVRMIVASFLSKHLLLDWRWGEAYFAEKLLDFELASNNGGWQWAAGSGCDAAPYFRIFNPYLQTKKFDPELRYIRQWVPELEDFSYPKPIVDHEFARKRVLAAYAAALKPGSGDQ